MATNFLIGRGEVLAHQVPPPPRNPGKGSIYSLAEAREVLIPQIQQAIESFDDAPVGALPDDLAVLKVIMNPAYISKSSFPQDLLKEAGLETVGSRTVSVTPRKWARKGPPQEVPTAAELHRLGRSHGSSR